MKLRIGKCCPAVLSCLVVLLVLAGCAGSGVSRPTVQPDTVQQVDVSRLDEGRTGFVVAEKNEYNAAQQKLFKLGVDALQKGEYDKAAGRFESITKTGPLLTSAHINLAIAYIRSGQEEKAEEPLTKVLKMAAGHPLASHEYGLLLRRAGRFDEARAVYEVALERFPEYYPLRRNLGVLCDLYLNDPECAFKEYELYLEAQPEDETVKLWLAEVRARSGQ